MVVRAARMEAYLEFAEDIKHASNFSPSFLDNKLDERRNRTNTLDMKLPVCSISMKIMCV